MIDELLAASEAALNGGDEHRMGRCPEFIEEWIPKLITEVENRQGEIDLLKRKLALTETQLLEAEARIKELEDAQ